jgi:hypothetical protein
MTETELPRNRLQRRARNNVTRPTVVFLAGMRRGISGGGARPLPGVLTHRPPSGPAVPGPSALADGLGLLLLAHDVEPARFDRAVPRWHARVCGEQRLSTGEAQLALAALIAMPGPGAQSAAQSLGAVCETHGLGRGGSGLAGLAQSPLTTRAIRVTARQSR